MDLATGPMGSLLLKLGKLVMDEYKLQRGVKRNVEELRRELASMQAALRSAGDVPYDQLGEQVKLWASDLRDLSYDAEDVVDAFMVRVVHAGAGRAGGSSSSSRLGLVKKVAGCLTKAKARFDIADEIKDLMDRAQEIAARRDRYKVDDIVSRFGNTVVDDSRLLLHSMYRNEAELVGIDVPRDGLINALMEVNLQEAIICVVGAGGLGKTTLARAVLSKVKPLFDCTAFVSVSRDPDMKKLFKDMLLQLDKEKYENIHNLIRDEMQLIGELREFIQNKRYFIVIDDLWDMPSWRAIRCALPDNNGESKIIITTRDFDIAKQVGIPHKLEALTPESSKKLFYGRVFGVENKCPEHLVEVSEMILKKCGDVPLAIVTIASMLAVVHKMEKSTDEWYKVYNSIGSGLANNDDMKDMRKILSVSYYSLPSHLRACLLYLSTFPEDYEISRTHLISLWIAEGFIRPEQDGDNLFDLGESYFSQLVNRSLIQPSYFDDDGTPQYFRVHDMILDLIRYLSTEENFVTVFGDILQHKSLGSKIRRLSFHNSKLEHTTTQSSQSMSEVRSLSVSIGFDICSIPALSSFRVLRVLDLAGCDLRKGCPLDLRHVWNLFLLRYIRLAGCIYDNDNDPEIPSEIENLKFLQALIIPTSVRLPPTFVELRKLMVLHVGNGTILPAGMGNLTSLEELTSVAIDKSQNFAKELRNLTKLRELTLSWDEMNESSKEAFIESLCSLRQIQHLQIFAYDGGSLDFMAERWSPAGHLRRFLAGHGMSRFSTVPAWITRDPSILTNLSDLSFRLEELRQEDLTAVGRLPALRSLFMYAARSERLLAAGAGEFCSLRSFHLWSDSFQLRFRQGAMPRLRSVTLTFTADDTRDGGNGGFDFGLENLLAIEHVQVNLDCILASHEEDAEAAMSRAAEVHPNHPTLEICKPWKKLDD